MTTITASADRKCSRGRGMFQQPEKKRRWPFFVFTGIGAFLAVVGVVLYFGVSLLLAGDCGNEPISEIQSPDKSLKVIIFQRDCGATTGFSTQVSILPATRSLPNESGNALVADTDHGKAPSGPGGGPEVFAEWKSSRELVLRLHPSARTFGIDTTRPQKIRVRDGWFGGTEVTVRVEQRAR